MASTPATASTVAPLEPQSEDEKRLLNIVASCVEDFEATIGREFRERCNRFYRQYRGFRKFADSWDNTTSENDRDSVIYDARVHWGAHLHIPLSFRTIETMVPRAIAQRPRLLYFPRGPGDEQNIDAVRLMIDAQQDNIDIDLPFQAVMRSGRIYGLGVGKVRWRTDQALKRGVYRSIIKPSEYRPGKLKVVTTFDDPYYEDVDVFDFMWDPYGSDLDTCEWVVHRSWLSLGQCLQRVESGAWNTEAAKKLLTEDQLRSMSPSTGANNRYDDVWRERMEASGFSSLGQGGVRGEQPHEVLEWHDGHRVLTVLDRQVLVMDGENPCLGHKPFTIYRPTPLQRQFVGIGDLEPIEHLQRELDTLRSQRRDAATMALAAGYAYDTAAVDREDLTFGPRRAIPVNNARPGDAILPLRVQEVPGTAYQDEQIIKGDIDVVSGVADETQGQIGGGTATETMMNQASLSLRIQLGSRRFEIETVRRTARQFLYLNQRMILSKRQVMGAPGMQPMDYSDEGNVGRWAWFDIGPDQLRGEFHIIPEGGSMAQRNIPQDRQDAIQMMNLFAANAYVDPKKPLLKSLELFGIKDPESWLKAGAAPVPPEVFQNLVGAGVDPSIISMAVSAAQRQDPQLAQDQPQGAPDNQAVAAMMNGGDGAYG